MGPSVEKEELSRIELLEIFRVQEGWSSPETPRWKMTKTGSCLLWGLVGEEVEEEVEAEAGEGVLQREEEKESWAKAMMVEKKQLPKDKRGGGRS